MRSPHRNSHRTQVAGHRFEAEQCPETLFPDVFRCNSLYHCAPGNVKAVSQAWVIRERAFAGCYASGLKQDGGFCWAESRINSVYDRLSASCRELPRASLRDGRRAGNRRLPLEGVLKLKYVVCLICLLLAVAAVDTIPDPPAISPPNSHSYGFSAHHVSGRTTLRDQEWLSGADAPHRDRLRAFSFRLVLENVPVGASFLPFVHHAADSSPPLLA